MSARQIAFGGPRRIQRRRTKGWRAPHGAVYVGRGSKWGNPFVLAPAASLRGGVLDMWAVEYQGRRLARWDDSAAARADAADRYARWIREAKQAGLAKAARAELIDRDLMCWCSLPEPGQPDHCHATVLLELANQPA
ncbi:DUF4326 domain-containing protein [Streptomyces shenzhenensis]|uniref:DUF4326 domain-containing protein n=1 Tax=Streptomyces shenzhenensis TaxID=943815 RepID=UPI00217EF5B7|nr:DUF4326 domain-containing protein [Streptomyces shenzhenensis]